MTALTAVRPLSAGETDINKLDLSGGPHTFTYNPFKQVLYVENNESGDITVNLLGDSVTSYDCPKYGTIDVSGGYDWVVPNTNSEESLYTITKQAYLGDSGNEVTMTITGATGSSFAYLAEY